MSPRKNPPSVRPWSEEQDRARRSHLQLPPGWSLALGNPRLRRTVKAGDFYTHILMPKSVLVAEEPVGDHAMRATVVDPGEGHLTRGRSYVFSLNLTVPIRRSVDHIVERLKELDEGTA